MRSLISRHREDSSDRVGKGGGMKRSSEGSFGLVQSTGCLQGHSVSPFPAQHAAGIVLMSVKSSEGLCCFSICMPGNVLVDTKEKLMQIQGYANADSGIGMYLPSQEPKCTSSAPVSQHMHSHGTSPAVRQWGRGPTQASWHTCLHPWLSSL